MAIVTSGYDVVIASPSARNGRRGEVISSLRSQWQVVVGAYLQVR